MKQLPILRNNFSFLKKVNSIILVLMIVLFACKKDKQYNSATNIKSDAFFNYTGSDTLIIKTIGQLKTFNNSIPFADSLSTIGSFKWDAYFKVVNVDENKHYEILVPYVNQQNILEGYIDIDVGDLGITTKPTVYNYTRDYLNNKDLVQRFVRGNSVQAFGRKDIILPHSFISQQSADKKQMADIYNGKPQPNSNINVNGKRKIAVLNECTAIYKITYVCDIGVDEVNRLTADQIKARINAAYLIALNGLYGFTYEITSEGLAVTGPSDQLNQQIEGALAGVLLNTNYVYSVNSIYLSEKRCPVQTGDGGDGGGGELSQIIHILKMFYLKTNFVQVHFILALSYNPMRHKTQGDGRNLRSLI